MALSSFKTIMCLAASFVSISAAALAQQSTSPQRSRIDFGKAEYESKCATCHGLTGKGDGPTAPFVTRPVSNLTTLAKSNSGILPISAMYDVIVGDKVVSAHGSRDMPVWGKEYRIQAAEYYGDVQYDPEAYVRVRVLALIEYINRLQAK
jgi:mono/diheme cytochrome c family protein